MPEIVQCPQCNRKLRVPDDLLGKKVKCPTCGTMFVGEVTGGPPPPPAEEPPAPPPRVTPKPAEKRSGRRPAPVADDGDNPLAPPDGPRRDATPHRGTLILILGILSIVTGLGIILGPIAWIMGSTDLKEIRAGRMDREGEGQTNGGMICGIVGTVMGLLTLCGCCAPFLMGIFGAAMDNM